MPSKRSRSCNTTISDYRYSRFATVSSHNHPFLHTPRRNGATACEDETAVGLNTSSG